MKFNCVINSSVLMPADNRCVQIGSGALPASCTVVLGVLSPGLKRGQGVTTTHPI